MNKFSWLILLALSTTVACKSVKRLEVVDKTKDLEKAQVYASIEKSNVVFQELSVNGSLQIEAPNGGITSNFTLRMYKDSIIWLSLKPFAGIELGRCFITKDSIFFLNRTNNTYIASGIDTLEKLTGTKLEISDLQFMLLGSMQQVLELNPSLEISESRYKLQKDTLGVNTEIDIFPVLFKPDRVRITSKSNANMYVEGYYLDYNKHQGQHMPTQLSLAFGGIDFQKLRISYSNFDFSSGLQYPFTIPSKYVKAN